MVNRLWEWWHAHKRDQLAVALGVVVWALFWFGLLLVVTR